MQFAARPIILFATLAFGSFALGAVTTATLSTVPAAPRAVQTFPVGDSDATVPLASTVTFPAVEAIAAPTF
ncbi:MAG: hypothetical protein K8R60_12705 [Burkholderiales bacterium]|nr:hypothetical protein [Burkholderiales bacterium]